MKAQDPRMVVEKFAEGSPETYELLSSIVFQYRSRKMTGIGYVQIDKKNGTFAAACFSPMGLKLFEISGDSGSTIAHFAMDDMTKKGDFAPVIADDIKRVYLDQVPSPDATVRRLEQEIAYSQPLGAGIVEYVFAGAGGNLVRKSYYQNEGLIWRVSYYDYTEITGKKHPFGITMRNYKYGYRLTIRVKEIIQ